jgi:hypothetical protein
MIRHILLASALAAAVPVFVLTQPHVVYRDGTAESLFQASRNAVGGEGTVSGLRSMILRGKAKVAEEDGGPEEREVEVRIALPDAMLRIDTAEGFEKRAGVQGATLLTSITSGGTTERPPAQARDAFVKAERARLGRLMLGMAAAPLRPGWLTLRSVRTATTTVDPRTTMGTDDPTRGGTALSAERAGARVLEGGAADGFFVRLFFDAQSLPWKLQYDAGKSRVELELLDRRRVSGLMLPYRLVTSANGRIVDDFTIREIVVNPTLTTADFER